MRASAVGRGAGRDARVDGRVAVVLVGGPERPEVAAALPQRRARPLDGLAERAAVTARLREERLVERLREQLGAHVVDLPGRADVVPDAQPEELVREARQEAGFAPALVRC